MASQPADGASVPRVSADGTSFIRSNTAHPVKSGPAVLSQITPGCPPGTLVVDSTPSTNKRLMVPAWKLGD